MRWKALAIAAVFAAASTALLVTSASSSGHRSETIWLYADVVEKRWFVRRPDAAGARVMAAMVIHGP